MKGFFKFLAVVGAIVLLFKGAEFVMSRYCRFFNRKYVVIHDDELCD